MSIKNQKVLNLGLFQAFQAWVRFLGQIFWEKGILFSFFKTQGTRLSATVAPNKGLE